MKNKYLLLRRITQIGILALFMLSSCDFILKGNLSSSILFNSISLSDPFAYLQIFLASFSLNFGLFISAFLVFIIYALFLGRAFCAWVCPINLITNLAGVIRQNSNLKSSKITNFKQNTRYFILFSILLLSFIAQEPVFEKYSHIGIVTRGIIFMQSSAIFVAIIIFLLDLFVQKNLVCSHLCPLGAFYSLISKFSFLKINYDLNKCTKCMKCKTICPENQVLAIITKNSGDISNSECIKCGRCIEVCDDDALNFNLINFMKGKK
ncbi:quinol dehydrogenase ferredoxin subunit NapH [Campylobacter sp. Cr9]|uniref:quinol dehydrogenase ferredoxin subunit NapH n=1 Tax=Campylobacter sp. Cr9 TaxID=2735728 RepID=UPI0030148BC6|nr:quinol dehydrogenase ferredoxin subunit NapH [Campylobacter sp. Cr9]